MGRLGKKGLVSHVLARNCPTQRCSHARMFQQDLDSLEQQNVWLRLVDLVVLPAQTLCDAQTSPLVFPQQLESASCAVEVVFGDSLEHLLGQLDVTVFVVVVVVSLSAQDCQH